MFFLVRKETTFRGNACKYFGHCLCIATLAISILYVLFLNYNASVNLLHTAPSRNKFDTIYYAEKKSHNAKIVAFTNSEYSLLAEIWYNRLSGLGYTEHVIVCTDKQSYKLLKHRSFRVESSFIANVPNSTTPYSSKIYLEKIRYAIRIVEMGQHVLISDTDNIFMRYIPLSDFLQEDYDIIHAYGTIYPENFFRKQKFVVCGCLIWLKATVRTLNFLRLVLKQCMELGKDGCDDQIAYNNALFLDAKIQLMPDPLWKNITRNDSQNRINNGLIMQSLEGKSPVTNHSFKVWDRNFAWRMSMQSEKCPSLSNWIAMPLTDDVEMKVDSFMEWDKKCYKSNMNI